MRVSLVYASCSTNLPFFPYKRTLFFPPCLCSKGILSIRLCLVILQKHQHTSPPRTSYSAFSFYVVFSIIWQFFYLFICIQPLESKFPESRDLVSFTSIPLLEQCLTHSRSAISSYWIRTFPRRISCLLTGNGLETTEDPHSPILHWIFFREIAVLTVRLKMTTQGLRNVCLSLWSVSGLSIPHCHSSFSHLFG